MLILTIFMLLFVTIIFAVFSSFAFPRFSKILLLTAVASVLILTCELAVSFNKDQSHFQHILKVAVGPETSNTLAFGLDGLSLIFFFLSAFLIFLCVIFVWEEKNFFEYAIKLLHVELLLLLVFTSLNVLLFYICFEGVLVPMFLLIGIGGSRERKIRAVYLFFFYTLCGSVLMLISILYMGQLVGSYHIEYLNQWTFTEKEQNIIWMTFFISFASKIPMFPFHLWLPEAHVEAPTVGSVLLAGVLLKLGVYGFLRFSLVLFPEASLYYTPLVYCFSTLGVIYGSITAIRQTDLKRVIAYSSIAHMNTVALGLFSLNKIGLEAGVLQSLSHGFVAGGLFFLIGIIYSRYHQRELQLFGGFTHTMPILSTLLLLFTLANIAIPGTSSFSGEFLLLLGVFKENAFVGFFASLGVVLCAAYSLWLYNRMVYGNLKINYIVQSVDVNKRECVVLLPLLFFILIVGIRSDYVTSFLSASVLFTNV